MPVRYLHYINIDGLHTYVARAQDLTQLQSFAPDDEGVALFTRWVQEAREGLHTVLVDASDEGFHQENIPRVFGADRRALITRKLSQHFFGSPYGTALSLGRERLGRKDERLLFTAITRPTLLDPWLVALRAAQAALSAVYSVPLLTESLSKRIFPHSSQGLILLLSDSGIRQIYCENGKLRFSRLAPPPDGPIARWGLDCLREAQKTYQYISAQRWLPRGTSLTVRIVLALQDSGPLLSEIQSASKANDNMVFELTSLESLSKQLGLEPSSSRSDCRLLLVQLALREGGAIQLAPSSERRFYRLWQARFATLILGAVVFAASALLSINWALDARSEDIETVSLRSEAALHESNYKRLLDSLPQMPTSLEALRSTVDAVDKLSSRVIDPRKPLLHLSHVLDNFPDITLDRIEWQDAGWSEDGKVTPSANNEAPRHALTVSASLDATASIDPRVTISRIRAFADSLQQASGGTVSLLQQPFDVESDKTLKSDAQNASKRPVFKLLLSLPEGKP